MSSEDELDEIDVRAWATYTVYCDCGESMEFENDPAGDRFNCDHCNAPLYVTGTY